MMTWETKLILYVSKENSLKIGHLIVNSILSNAFVKSFLYVYTRICRSPYYEHLLR
jgi:hypothetical protein